MGLADHSTDDYGQRAHAQSCSGTGCSGQLRKDTMHFYVTLETEGRVDGLQRIAEHVQEEVGWAAFDVAHSSLGGVVYEAGKTPLAVTHEPYRIPFTGFFRTAPEFFANLGTYHGDDSAQARLIDDSDDEIENAITPSYATVFVEEEQCTGETEGYAHGLAEEVDYFAVNKGIGANADRPRGGMIASRILGSDRVGTGQAGNHVPFAETGDLTLAWSWESNWQTVGLKHYYLKPAVIMGSPSTTGGEAVTVRIRNLRHGQGCEGWCFDVRLQEPSCMDQGHVPETVHYMVMETGSWSGDEGTMMQAGVNEIEGDMRLNGGQFQVVQFLQGGFPGGELPVVLTQVMSYYGSNFVKTRKIVMLSRSAALSVSLTLKVSPLQASSRPTPPRSWLRWRRRGAFRATALRPTPTWSASAGWLSSRRQATWAPSISKPATRRRK